MGTAATKVLHCLTEEEKYQNSYFYKEQIQQYSYQLSDQCLQHLTSLNMSSFISLKKIYRYLHPALKFKYSTNNKSDIDEVLQHYENDLLQSTVYVARMYLSLLEKVVPTNITYFHFMRQKDLYCHYVAITYVLQFGYLNGALARRNHIFERISLEEENKMLKIVSHWLYDMVKYYCSAIYIHSYTMPHLINILYIFIVGILQNKKENNLTDFTHEQRQQIYEHILYVSTYLLCKGNKQNDYSMVQIICGCFIRLFNEMQIYPFEKQIYAPSYWYVEEVGYIHEPILSKVCAALIVDLLNVDKKRILLKENELHEKRKRKHKKEDKSYSSFEDEDDVKQQETVEHILTHKIKKEEELNFITNLYLYYSLSVILKNSPKSHRLPYLLGFLSQIIRKIRMESLIRPFILEIIEIIDVPNSMMELKEYDEKSKLDYDVEREMMGWEVVMRSCKMIIEGMLQENMEKLNVQLEKEEREVWRQILKGQRGGKDK